MSKVIEGLYYSESHEWVKVEGNFGYIGITDYAQNALGNIVYVDMPDVDDEIEKDSEFGAVESVKAASDLITDKGLEALLEAQDKRELWHPDGCQSCPDNLLITVKRGSVELSRAF